MFNDACQCYQLYLFFIQVRETAFTKLSQVTKSLHDLKTNPETDQAKTLEEQKDELLESIQSFIHIFRRLSFFCPISQISDVFYLLFRSFQEQLDKVREQSDGELFIGTAQGDLESDKWREYQVHEFISPYLKSGHWG